MLLLVILALLLIGNWFFTEILILTPVNLAINFTSLGWWVLALFLIAFVAWCISDD
jgi:hypothetical protein